MSRILLVHLSDLHIGSGVIGTTGPHVGFHGHELTYCEHLQKALARQLMLDFSLQPVDRLHYVVSGDLTRTGSTNDFVIALEFLWESWTRRDRLLRTTTGLSLPAGSDRFSAVPGNHDHWNGYDGGWRPPAYNPQVFPTYFENTPWWSRPIWADASAWALELFGVDSNKGLQGKKANRRARGVLPATELTALDTHLNQSQADAANDQKPRIRAIVCHHAFNKGKQHWLAYARPLEKQSMNALLQTAHPYGVAAVLTGHTHDFEAHPYTNASTNNTIYELRAASATQMGTQPEPQGFWAHELSLQGQQVTWSAWKYQLNAQGSQFDRIAPAITVR